MPTNGDILRSSSGTNFSMWPAIAVSLYLYNITKINFYDIQIYFRLQILRADGSFVSVSPKIWSLISQAIFNRISFLQINPFILCCSTIHCNMNYDLPMKWEGSMFSCSSSNFSIWVKKFTDLDELRWVHYESVDVRPSVAR